jgi:hypothetical protein
MDNQYRLMTRHRGIVDYLQNISNPFVKVKVTLNGKKLDTHIYPDQVRLRSILPDLEINKIYLLNLYYKENGEYYLSELKNIILVKEDDKICIYENKNGRLNGPISNYLLFGYSKKKIVIQEVDKKIIHIHIQSLSNEKLTQSINGANEFYESICIDGDKEIDIDRKIDDILCNYVYQIQKKEKIDEDKNICQVYVEVVVDRKKNIWRRFFNYLFNK